MLSFNMSLATKIPFSTSMKSQLRRRYISVEYCGNSFLAMQILSASISNSKTRETKRAKL